MINIKADVKRIKDANAIVHVGVRTYSEGYTSEEIIAILRALRDNFENNFYKAMDRFIEEEIKEMTSK